MTITNEPTTTPEVPAWLNLDAYCPPEVRHALNDSADEIEELLERFVDIVHRAYDAHTRQEDHADGMGMFDDHWIILGDLTGYNRHQRAARRLEALAGLAACEEWPEREDLAGDAPGWFQTWAERRGLKSTEGMQS